LNDNSEENGQKINQRGNISDDRPVNPERNVEIGQNVQGSEPGVQTQASRENGTKIQQSNDEVS